MADIAITPGNVIAASGATKELGTAGATITAGQIVYKDLTDSDKFKLAINDDVLTAVILGVALNGASSGQPLFVHTTGGLNPGETVVVGEIYCCSLSAGGIAPEAEVVGNDFVSVLGIGTTSSSIAVKINNSGVAVQ